MQFDRHQPYVPMICRDMYNAHRTVYKDFPQRCFGDCHCIWWHSRNCYHNNINKSHSLLNKERKKHYACKLYYRIGIFSSFSLYFFQAYHANAMPFVSLHFSKSISPIQDYRFVAMSFNSSYFFLHSTVDWRIPVAKGNNIVIFYSLSFTSMPLFARLARNVFNVRYITLSEIQLHASRHNLLIPRNK